MVLKTSSGPDFLSLEETAGLITDGSLIAIGGRMEMEPMAFIRALVRHRKKDLRLVTVPGGGLAVDMLIGAGCVKSVESPQIGLSEFSQAPHFRRSAQNGEIKVLDQV